MMKKSAGLIFSGLDVMIRLKNSTFIHKNPAGFALI